MVDKVLEQLIEDFDRDKLIQFYKQSSDKFRSTVSEDYSNYLPEGDRRFGKIEQIGQIDYEKQAKTIAFFVCPVSGELSEKDSKKKQYEIGKKILKDNYRDAGIFVFHGDKNFRLSLIAASYSGPKREFTTFRRYTYFVSPDLTNKTFKDQLKKCDFSSIEKILEAFSIEAVSNKFYNYFKPIFDEIVNSIKGNGKIDSQTKQDFALLFAIRIIFLGFVQKKGWLGDNQKFIQNFWYEYNQHKKKSKCNDEFYTRWLEPLFFEALNSQPGTKVQWHNNDFSVETEKTLQMSPFLNGELYKRKHDVDDIELYLPDEIVGKFFFFLFQYNFTIDENTAYDEEIELNPEFLGIIFERFVNKEQGSVYTPRTEVDLMCRLALIRWLIRKNEFDTKELYHLFFREGGAGFEYEEDQKYGNFSAKEIRKLLEYLENVTVCDPAAGSGAFEVGMLHVINDIIETFYTKMPDFPNDIVQKSGYERKKDIIARSLYGVEVQGYAVWINQLRLWLTLFIDMPDNLKTSLTPLLPSLNFKIRRGDSIVQRVGGKLFPVHGHADVTDTIKKKIKALKEAKLNFYYNQGQDEVYVKQQEYLVFQSIIQSEIQEIDKLIELRNSGMTKGASGPQLSLLDSDSRILGRQSKLFNTIETGKTGRKMVRDIQLENRKQELLDELKNLSNDHPLIWSIEFSEIFYDKGGFDIIIGNPPYVNQLEIADPEGKVEPKEYKKLLRQTTDLDYPRHFKNRIIDGKSDLYTFFYVRTLYLLNQDGVHCFICSNSWLDAHYGVWLQEFLLENVPVNLIIDNHARRSFASSDVNTVITLFDAPEKSYNKAEHLIKFVAFKKPFEECVFTEMLWDIRQANKIIKNDIFRLYPITAEELYDKGWEIEEGAKQESGEYIGDKWGGKYLRAPDIFFTILEKGKDKLSKLKVFAEVRRGFTTGCNEFFYLTDAKAKEWGIEEKFLKPVIKNPRESKNIHLDNTKLDYKILYLQSLDDKTALKKYIKYGETKNYHKRPTCAARKNWWNIGIWETAHCFWMESINDINRVYLNKTKILESDKFYGITFKEQKDNVENSISLNATIYALFRELKGFHGMGQGVLKLPVYDVKNMIFIKSNYERINTSKLLDREQNSIFEECGIDPESDIPIEEQEPKPLPDRKELDDIVFGAIGLTEEERKEVYRAVCRLVWNRISKAKSVKKR